MNVCLIGWYGTETIGDRAILAGVFIVLSILGYINKVYLGSLYPFFSRRTISEDVGLYELLSNKKIDISVFDSAKKGELEEFISKSDIVVIAGGPLMDLEEMYMLRYAFRFAKARGKNCWIMGCGIGPLFCKKYISCLHDILIMADLIILRDYISLSQLKNISSVNIFEVYKKKIQIIVDPACLCLWKYRKIKGNFCRRDYIAANFRDFPMEYIKNGSYNVKIVKNFIHKLLKDTSRDILLIPMHYFFIGNDDRYFLNKLKIEINKSRLVVQNKPLSLTETMDVFAGAFLNVGMRFHSVVFQSILNGKNYIIDYTDPQYGKILGFIDAFDKKRFYKDRYINIQTFNAFTYDFDFVQEFPKKDIEKYCELGLIEYCNVIKKALE